MSNPPPLRQLLPWLGLGWLFDLAGFYLIFIHHRVDVVSIGLLVIGGLVSVGGVLYAKRRHDAANPDA